jgi:hypothetical protein
VKALPKPGTEYYWWLREWAIGTVPHSDGCTHIKDIHVVCCWQHDFCCQMGFDPRFYLEGQRIPITKWGSARLIRQCLIQSSKLNRFSPIAWTFWLALISPFGSDVNKQWWMNKVKPA